MLGTTAYRGLKLLLLVAPPCLQFFGYLKIDVAGTYTFYLTRSVGQGTCDRPCFPPCSAAQAHSACPCPLLVAAMMDPASPLIVSCGSTWTRRRLEPAMEAECYRPMPWPSVNMGHAEACSSQRALPLPPPVFRTQGTTMNLASMSLSAGFHEIM